MRAFDQVAEAYAAASPRLCHEGVWLMDRTWYDRIRAEGISEDAERDRAWWHANAMISQDAAEPLHCPVCPGGPFTRAELIEHIARKADLHNREPDPRDVLMGRPVIVRDDGGPPHLVER